MYPKLTEALREAMNQYGPLNLSEEVPSFGNLPGFAISEALAAGSASTPETLQAEDHHSIFRPPQEAFDEVVEQVLLLRQEAAEAGVRLSDEDAYLCLVRATDDMLASGDIVHHEIARHVRSAAELLLGIKPGQPPTADMRFPF